MRVGINLAPSKTQISIFVCAKVFFVCCSRRYRRLLLLDFAKRRLVVLLWKSKLKPLAWQYSCGVDRSQVQLFKQTVFA